MELPTKLTNGHLLGVEVAHQRVGEGLCRDGLAVELYLPGGTVNVTVRPSDETVGIADAASGCSW